jgi:hypothetical protein
MAARVQRRDSVRPVTAATLLRMEVGNEAGTMATWAKRAGKPSGLGDGGGFCWVCFHNREMISPDGSSARSPERAGLAKWSRPREWAAGPGAPAQLGGPRRMWGAGLVE